MRIVEGDTAVEIGGTLYVRIGVAIHIEVVVLGLYVVKTNRRIALSFSAGDTGPFGDDNIVLVILNLLLGDIHDNDILVILEKVSDDVLRIRSQEVRADVVAVRQTIPSVEPLGHVDSFAGVMNRFDVLPTRASGDC